MLPSARSGLALSLVGSITTAGRSPEHASSCAAWVSRCCHPPVFGPPGIYVCAAPLTTRFFLQPPGIYFWTAPLTTRFFLHPPHPPTCNILHFRCNQQHTPADGNGVATAAGGRAAGNDKYTAATAEAAADALAAFQLKKNFETGRLQKKK